MKNGELFQGLPDTELGAAAQSVQKEPPAGKPRLKIIDRAQVLLRPVDLESLIEQEHPARGIWTLTGQLNLEPFYAPIGAREGLAGRAAWDPRLLISLWVYAYSRGIGSAREIARRCTSDSAFQWLCGTQTINHHTLSDFRVSHGPALEELFSELLGVLSAQGLVSLERVMHDGTKIKADVSTASFRKEERLQAHLEAARKQVQELASQVDEEPSRHRAAQQRAARERQSRVEQALEELEKIRQSKRGEKDKQSTRASTTDPEARIMKQPDSGFAPSYNVQISTEASHKIIVGVGVSQSRSDYGELTASVQRIEQNLQAKPKQMVTDGGFTSRENILSMEAQGIDFIGSWGKQDDKGVGSQKQRGVGSQFLVKSFSYDAQQNIYTCPAGQKLKYVGKTKLIGVERYLYRAQAHACQACGFKTQCCPDGTQGRSVARSVEEPEIEQFRKRMETSQAQEVYRRRGPVAEFPNAWIKEKLGLRRFHVRGLLKVEMEAIWACLTYNIQQWVRLCWKPSLSAART